MSKGYRVRCYYPFPCGPPLYPTVSRESPPTSYTRTSWGHVGSEVPQTPMSPT